ncbi:MAG: tetratricopeptide repeat protein [Planctomycetota bacterium]
MAPKSNPYSVTLETTDEEGGPDFARLESRLRVALYAILIPLSLAGIVFFDRAGFLGNAALLFIGILFLEYALRIKPLLPRAISAFYRSPASKHYIGCWWYARNQFDNAWHEFDRTTREHPNYAPGWASLGTTYCQLQDFLRCIECCDRALELRGNLWQALLARGMAKHELGDSGGALEDLAAAVWQEPDELSIRHTRGYVLHQLGDSEAALNDLAHAVKTHPHDLPIRLVRLGIFVEQRCFGDALAEAKNVIELHPKSFEVLIWAAHAALSLKRIEDAIEFAERAIKQDRRHPSGWQMRGNAFLDSGRHDEALADYERALHLNPQDYLILNGIGLAKHFQGDHLGAVEAFDRSIEWHPENALDAVVLSNRGLARNALGEYLAAAEDYQRAITLDPMHPNPLKNWASQLATCPVAEFRDGEQAVRLATQALELCDWKQTEWLPILAAAHAEAGDFEAAITRQLEGDPEDLERLKLYRAGRPYRTEQIG